MKQIVSNLSVSEDSLRPYPAFSLLYFFLSTSLPLGMLDFGYGNKVWTVVLIMVLPLVGLLVLPKSPRKWIWMSVFGASVTWLHIWAPWRSYEKYLLRPEVYVEIQAVVTDDRMLDDDSLSSLAKTKNIEVNISKLRLSQFEDWQECRGKILLLKPTTPLEYGMGIVVKGALVLPWKNDIPGLFDYRNYLKSKGIKHVMRGDELIVTGSNPVGWRKAVEKLIHVREALLTRIIRHVDGDRNQKILAAMTLGFRQSLSPDDKEIYIRSGMIHILAISGLHVGILYSLIHLSLSLMRVPFTLRHFIAPGITFIYVVATGAPPSAMRAGLMLTLWAVGRGLRLPVMSVNTILVTALLLLVYNPFHMFQSGFQFSFVVVLSLVMGWNTGKKLISYLNEKRFWTPTHIQNTTKLTAKAGSLALGTLVSMGSAWLGALGLTAFYNNLFLPSSFLTNIFICLWAWVVIVLGILKTSLSYLPFLTPEVIAANGLSLCLSILHLVGEFSSQHGGGVHIPQPSILITFAYYIIVFTLLSLSSSSLGKRFLVLLCLCTVALNIVFPIHQLIDRTRIIVFVPVNSVTPAIVIAPSGFRREPVIINGGTRRFGYAFSSWLKNRGTDIIDKLIVLDDRVDYYGGAIHLLTNFQVRTSVLPASRHRGMKELRGVEWKNGCRRRLTEDDNKGEIHGWRITNRTRHYRLAMTNEKKEFFQIEIAIKGYEGSSIKIITKDLKNHTSRSQEWKFFYTNKNVIKYL